MFGWLGSRRVCGRGPPPAARRQTLHSDMGPGGAIGALLRKLQLELQQAVKCLSKPWMQNTDACRRLSTGSQLMLWCRRSQ